MAVLELSKRVARAHVSLRIIVQVSKIEQIPLVSPSPDRGLRVEWQLERGG